MDLFAEADKPVRKGKRVPTRSDSSLPAGIIRLQPKVFDSAGEPKPKPYIFDRIRAVEGLTVEVACKLEFADKAGRPRPYRRDISYDLFNSEWIRIESPKLKEHCRGSCHLHSQFGGGEVRIHFVFCGCATGTGGTIKGSAD